MAGGILQLVEYGAQNVYLTDKPKITFFKIVYKRYTNFSIEPLEYTIQDSPNFGKKSNIVILRNGDLITEMYLKIKISKVILPENGKFAWIKRLGHAIIKNISISIGGIIIDKHIGTWLDIWYELARNGEHEKGYKKLIGETNELIKYNNKNKPEYELFIPLKFWFNKNIGLALPIINIQYHKIELKIEFEKINKLIITNDYIKEVDIKQIFIENVRLIINFVYLEDDERKKFLSNGQEYLIEILQYREDNITKIMNNIRLNFNYPTKELFWCLKNGNFNSNKKFLCYTTDNWDKKINDFSKDLIKNSILLLDDADDINNYDYNQEVNINGEILIINNIDGNWVKFSDPSSFYVYNNNIYIFNDSDKTLWFNETPLILNNINLLDKINAFIIIDENYNINFENLAFSTDINISDLSIPLINNEFQDSRLRRDYVYINMFSNYGLYLDESLNPFDYAMIKYNDQYRVTKKTANFFNYLQPEYHHNNIPKDGINIYSFSIKPELHQPSGTSNLSLIDKVYLEFKLKEKYNDKNLLSDLKYLNENTEFFIFAYSYNILRISNGLAGLVYN